MFENLQYILNTDPIRGYMVMGSMIIILAFMIWVSAIDIKKKSITFWKMLLASSTTILCPLFTSFFCGCKHLKFFLMGALVLWIILLAFNVFTNKSKFIGKADIDLLSALFAETIMFSFWLGKVIESQYLSIRLTQVWYTFFLYLVLGAIMYVLFFVIYFGYKLIRKKMTFKEMMKTKIAVVPMLVPMAVMIPYMIMTA